MNQAVLETLQNVRSQSPLVQSITNYVVMQVTANALLAAGASPLMAHEKDELDDLLAIDSALVINIGTLDTPWIASMKMAAQLAMLHHKPMVLDPVGAGATRLRTTVALDLLAQGHPAVVRGNASEILALAGEAGATKGVDSTRGSNEALAVSLELARRFQTVISVSGEEDFITDGQTTLIVRGGDPMMTRVTGMGCSASALTGACVAVASSPLVGAAAAMALMAEAGSAAAAVSKGPGSFLSQFLDALYNADLEHAAGRVFVA